MNEGQLLPYLLKKNKQWTEKGKNFVKFRDNRICLQQSNKINFSI